MYITPGTHPGYTQCSTDCPEATTSSLSFGLDSFSPLSLWSLGFSPSYVWLYTFRTLNILLEPALRSFVFLLFESTVLPLPTSLPVQQFLDEGIKVFFFLGWNCCAYAGTFKGGKEVKNKFDPVNWGAVSYILRCCIRDYIRHVWN